MSAHPLLAQRRWASLQRYTHAEIRAALPAMEEDWPRIDTATAEQHLDETAVYNLVETVHCLRVGDAAALERHRHESCGAKTERERNLITRLRSLREQSKGSLYVPQLWAFEESGEGLTLESCSKASESEMREAYTYTQEHAAAWGVFRQCSPELVAVSVDVSFKEAQAKVAVLQYEMVAPEGPNPAVFHPQFYQEAMVEANNHPAQVLHKAWFVYFMRRRKAEAIQLKKLIAQMDAKRAKKAAAA